MRQTLAELRATQKAHREANKEKRAAYNKKWQADNKEYVKAQREANKDVKNAKNRAYRKSLNDGHYSVYYLPEEHYVGVTGSTRQRMHKHNHDGMITEGLEVVYTTKSKEDAYSFEAKLHSMGYNGSEEQGYLSKRANLKL